MLPMRSLVRIPCPPQLLRCGEYNKGEHRIQWLNCVVQGGIHSNPRCCDKSEGLMERVQNKADGASVSL